MDRRRLGGRALLYLSGARVEEIRDRIFDYQDFMEAFAGRPTLDQLVDGVSTQIAAAFLTSFIDLGLSDGKAAVDVRFVEDLVRQVSERLDRPTPYHSPWGGLFSVGHDSASARHFLSP